MMKFEKLSAGYGDNTVLKDVSGAAQRGDFIALVGPNGCGKSTLLKTLCGIINPTSGQVNLDGVSTANMPIKSRAKKIAYLAQSREAMPVMSVMDVISLGRAPYRGSLGRLSTAGKAAINSALSRTQSGVFSDRRFDSLSGGEQARILLARALAVEAPVLLADEPIAALDPYYQLTMMEILKAEATSGKIVIAALHDLSLAAQFASRIWVMHDGQIVSNDTPLQALSENVLKTVFGIRMPLGGFQPLHLSC